MVLATVFACLPFVVREVAPVLEKIAIGAGAGGVDTGRSPRWPSHTGAHQPPPAPGTHLMGSDVRGVTKRFRDFVALDDVSVEIPT
ncbi:MAG TPA: hypothetical protein VHF00_05600 [Acidimicrobiales bacterium]|nr:hypothetical protein [Acidimicrobiales bacterium]